MDYSVFASDEYTVTVSRALWQILWRAHCRSGRLHLSKALPNELSGTVMRELRSRKELSPGTRDAVHAFAREAIIEPNNERVRRWAEADEERDKRKAVNQPDERDIEEGPGLYFLNALIAGFAGAFIALGLIIAWAVIFQPIHINGFTNGDAMISMAVLMGASMVTAAIINAQLTRR